MTPLLTIATAAVLLNAIEHYRRPNRQAKLVLAISLALWYYILLLYLLRENLYMTIFVRIFATTY